MKLATLGNIRLIGELFKEKMIMERILHACITDLMGKDNKKDVPPEENLEALCNLLMTGAPLPTACHTPPPRASPAGPWRESVSCVGSEAKRRRRRSDDVFTAPESW